MKKLIAGSLVAALVFGLPWMVSAQKQPGNLSRLMQEKLSSAKLMLEGIATADFKKISRSGETLIELSKTAEWFVYKTPRYEIHSNEFRNAAETVLQKAKDQNLDGVTLAYFELTMSCVKCHQYVREIRDARAPLPLDRKVVLSAREMP